MNDFFQWVMLHNRPWDTHPPLSDAETEELFELMADPSLDDDAMTIDMADGYMTACAIGPSPVPVHLWLEDIFAQPTLPLPHDPVRQQRLLQLLMRRYSDIQAALSVPPAETTVDTLYTPLSSELEEGDCITPHHLNARGDRIGDWELKYWAEGFRRAVAADDEWEPLLIDPEAAPLLAPVVLYSTGYNPDNPDFQLEAESHYPPSLYALRDWWRQYRRPWITPGAHHHANAGTRHPQGGPQRPLPLRQWQKIQEMLRRLNPPA